MIKYEVDIEKEFAGVGAKGGVLECYVHEYIEISGMWKNRPSVLVVPGGSYATCSAREKDSVAFKFFADGFNVFVMTYSVFPEVFPTQVLEMASVVCHIKDNAEKYMIDPDKITLVGFSAGGHLVASYCCFATEVCVPILGVEKSKLAVACAVLGYPVISSGEFAHKRSIGHISGGNGELWEKLSLEHRVQSEHPPTFLWHTSKDQLVPVQNSILYYSALLEKGVKCALHIFADGVHGGSTCEHEVRVPKTKESPSTRVSKENSAWVELAKTFVCNVIKYDKFEK